jgi:hypothetical protein
MRKSDLPQVPILLLPDVQPPRVIVVGAAESFRQGIGAIRYGDEVHVIRH